MAIDSRTAFCRSSIVAIKEGHWRFLKCCAKNFYAYGVEVFWEGKKRMESKTLLKELRGASYCLIEKLQW